MSEPAKVKWTISYTMNLGNFQSLKLDCGVEDFAREEESVEAASNRVYKFVETQLIKKVAEAKKELNEQ